MDREFLLRYIEDMYQRAHKLRESAKKEKGACYDYLLTRAEYFEHLAQQTEKELNS